MSVILWLRFGSIWTQDLGFDQRIYGVVWFEGKRERERFQQDLTVASVSVALQTACRLSVDRRQGHSPVTGSISAGILFRDMVPRRSHSVYLVCWSVKLS